MKVENVPQLRSERKAAAECQRDVVLLALKTEGKAQAKECWQLLEARQDKARGSSLESAARTPPCGHVSPGNLVLDF